MCIHLNLMIFTKIIRGFISLEPAIGKSNRVYEVLNRKRNLTLPMIRKLHTMFGIPLKSLVGG